MWGDGEQTRSFMFIDDCVEGTIRIMEGDYKLPLNLGTEEMVRELFFLVSEKRDRETDRQTDRQAGRQTEDIV